MRFLRGEHNCIVSSNALLSKAYVLLSPDGTEILVADWWFDYLRWLDGRCRGLRCRSASFRPRLLKLSLLLLQSLPLLLLLLLVLTMLFLARIL